MKKVLVLVSIIYTLTHAQKVQGCARYTTNPQGQIQCRFCDIPLFLVDGQCLQCPHGQKFVVDTCIEISDISQSSNKKLEKVEQYPEIARCLEYQDETRSICDKCQEGYKVEEQTSKKCIVDDRTVFCRLYSQVNKNCMLCDNGYILNDDNICEQKQTADQKLKISNNQRIIEKQKQESQNSKKKSNEVSEQIDLQKPTPQETKMGESNQQKLGEQKLSSEQRDPLIHSSDNKSQQTANKSQNLKNSENAEKKEIVFQDFFSSTFELLKPLPQETTKEKKEPIIEQNKENVFEDFFDSTFEVFKPLSEQTVTDNTGQKQKNLEDELVTQKQQKLNPFSNQNNQVSNESKGQQKDIPDFPKFPSFPNSPQQTQKDSTFNLRKEQLNQQSPTLTSNSEQQPQSSGQQANQNQQIKDKPISKQQPKNINNNQFSLVTEQIKKPNQQIQEPNQQIQEPNQQVQEPNQHIQNSNDQHVQNSFSFNTEFGEEFTFSEEPKSTIKDNQDKQEETSELSLIQTNLNENKQPESSDNKQEATEQTPIIHLYPQFPFCVDFFEGQCYACDPAFVLDLIINQCVRLKQDPRGKAKILLPSQNQEDFCNIRDKQTGQCSECFRNHYYNKQKKKCIEFNRLCRSVDEENGDCLSCYNNYELFRGDCKQIDV